MVKKITNSDLKFFKLNGFLKVKNLFPNEVFQLITDDLKSSDEIKNADGVIYDLIDGKKELRYLPRPHIVMPSFLKLVNSNILSISSKLLDQSSYFFGIDLHCRAAGSEQATLPHQDSFLFCFEPGYNAKYSLERQKKYKEFVAFNRASTLKEGLTNSIPKPQHN